MNLVAYNSKEIKNSVIKSYFNVASFPLAAFITARTLLLPLERFHEVLPDEGVIAEIGCGHGIVSQYLARRLSTRQIIGFDPDSKRTELAVKAGKDIENLEYRAELFPEGSCKDLSGVVIIGVFCLLEDKIVQDILYSIRKALQPGGRLLISDIPVYNGGDWIHWFHLTRERFLNIIGFTQGQGIFLRTEQQWQQMLVNADFSQGTSFHAPVFMHKTFNSVWS
jgi:SAM-dependent methyltransferase